MESLIRLGIVAGALFLFACGDDNDPPRFRLQNDADEEASVQIKTSGGNTININNIEPDSVSPYQNSSQGQIDITATVKSDTTTLLGSFNAVNDESYTIHITNPPGVVIDSP